MLAARIHRISPIMLLRRMLNNPYWAKGGGEKKALREKIKGKVRVEKIVNRCLNALQFSGAHHRWRLKKKGHHFLRKKKKRRGETMGNGVEGFRRACRGVTPTTVNRL